MRAILIPLLLIGAGCKGDNKPATSTGPTTTGPTTTGPTTTGQAASKPRPEIPNKPSPPSPASIGEAWMEDDGTIVMNLRAESADGAVGHSQLRYPKDHPRYADTLKHLGGLQPGERKPVPPFPDSEPKAQTKSEFPAIENACTSNDDCIRSGLTWTGEQCCPRCITTAANKTWLAKAEKFCESYPSSGSCGKYRCAKPKDVECRAGTCQFVE